MLYLSKSVLNKTITIKFMTLYFSEKVTGNIIFVIYYLKSNM